MEISAAMVRELREKTGLPMMDCKKALTEASGDMEAAIESLKKSAHGRISKLAGRETAEGRVACFIDPKSGRGGIVELRCETAPVSNTDDFIRLANAAAFAASQLDNPTPEAVLGHALQNDPSRKVSDALHDVVNKIRENMQVHRVASLSAPIGSYVHHNAQVGVLVQFSAPPPDEMKLDVSMHVAAMRPTATRRDEADPKDVAREREIAAESAIGKPAPVVEKIVSGKLDRWYSEFVLLEQPFVKDDKHSVGQVLKAINPNLTINRFVRFEVGGS